MNTNLENWLQSQKLINKSELARVSNIAPGEKAARTKLAEHINGTKTNQVVQTKIRASLQQLLQELQTILEEDQEPEPDPLRTQRAGRLPRHGPARPLPPSASK